MSRHPDVRTRRWTILGGALVAALSLASDIDPELRGDAPSNPRAYLVETIGLGGRDIARLDRGEPVSRVMPAESGEYSMFGAIEVGVPPERLAAAFADIARFKRGERVLAVGRFGDPPRVEDLAELTLPRGDIEALARCEVGDCDVKLSAKMIQRFRSSVDWTAPDASERANRLFRGLLVAYARDYLRRGNAALITYHDKEVPVSLVSNVRAFLGRSPQGYGASSDLLRFVADYPHARREGVEDFLYWTQEDFRPLKTVISMTHVFIDRRNPTDEAIVIVSKQIYASHYMEAYLAQTSLAARSAEDRSQGYLMYLSQTASDALKGWLPLRRKIVETQARRTMERSLERARDKLEAGRAETVEGRLARELTTRPEVRGRR